MNAMALPDRPACEILGCPEPAAPGSRTCNAHRGELVLPASGPGRQLGLQRKPQLRLALGYRDEQRSGAPVKTDYFIPHGDDRMVQKFVDIYGDKPREIDIRLPGSLGGFLEIKHVAFAGGQGGGGGVLRAIGATNFALEGTLGGPDKLTVFTTVDSGKKDKNNNAIPELQSEEIYIDDVTDPVAVELGVYLQATVSFGIPDVLGFGGACEIRSRGKETIDTLWLTAVDIYGQLGAHASMVLRPKLILKESTMMTPRGQKAQLFVVDLIVPESLDEVVARLREMREILPGGAAQSLYGTRPELVEASPERAEGAGTPAVDRGADTTDPTPAAGQDDAAAAGAPDPHDPPAADDELKMLADAAAVFVPPVGKYGDGRGTQNKKPGAEGPKTLADILVVDAKWFEWALKNIDQPDDYRDAIWHFTRVYAPATYTKVAAEKSLQS